MTDYLPPTGFKHAPSPALDYARLPHKEEDAEMLAQVQAEAEAPTDTQGNLAAPTTDSELSEAARRASIGPFGECVPVRSIDGSDIYRVQFYADNDALKLPMVSPIFDREHLRGLPRLLVVCVCVFAETSITSLTLIHSNAVQQRDYVMNQCTRHYRHPTVFLAPIRIPKHWEHPPTLHWKCTQINLMYFNFYSPTSQFRAQLKI